MSVYYPATLNGEKTKLSATAALKAVAAGARVVFLVVTPRLMETLRVTNWNRDCLVQKIKSDRGRIYLTPWPEGQKPSRAERKGLSPNTHATKPKHPRVEATGQATPWERLPPWVRPGYQDQMGTLAGYGPVAP